MYMYMYINYECEQPKQVNFGEIKEKVALRRFKLGAHVIKKRGLLLEGKRMGIREEREQGSK